MNIISNDRAKNKDLVNKLQGQAKLLLFDNMMHDINDSLTSILAICDIEANHSIPKIKSNINRINSSLQSTKSYHVSEKEGLFDTNLIVENVVNVLLEHYKDQLNITRLFSEVKVPVLGSQSELERMMFHFFVLVLSSSPADKRNVTLELKQKDQDALVSLECKEIEISDESIDYLSSLSEHFFGKLQISKEEGGIKMTMRIPLDFNKCLLKDRKSQEWSVSDVKVVTEKVKPSISSGDLNYAY